MRPDDDGMCQRFYFCFFFFFLLFLFFCSVSRLRVPFIGNGEVPVVKEEEKTVRRPVSGVSASDIGRTLYSSFCLLRFFGFFFLRPFTSFSSSFVWRRRAGGQTTTPADADPDAGVADGPMRRSGRPVPVKVKNKTKKNDNQN